MRKIIKGNEPTPLTVWKRANPNGRYQQLTNHERQAIREACTQEQLYLCAYCCQTISGTAADTMNEHVEAQKIAPNKSLDFNNIVASCTTPYQCDDAHGSQPLPLTPLMVECKTELQFMLSGRVNGLTERAKSAISVLNLGDHERNNKRLIEKRKYLTHSLLLENGVDPDEGLEDEELLLMLIDDLSTPQDGRLAPYAPVVVNVLRQWIAA